MLIVRADISKASHRYLTFLSDEGCEYLLAHLQERVKAGEELGPDSPIIAFGERGLKSHYKIKINNFP